MPTTEEQLTQLNESVADLVASVNITKGYLQTAVTGAQASAVASAAAKDDAEDAELEAEAARDVTLTARADTQAARDVTLAAKEAALVAAEGSGDVRFFDTKAEAVAGLGPLPENQVVEIFKDETRDNARVRYRKESGTLVFKIKFPEYEIDKTRDALVTFATVAKG